MRNKSKSTLSSHTLSSSHRRGSIHLVLALVLFLLLACGDDTTTEVITQSGPNHIKIVDEESELPECTEDNEGIQIIVKGEPVARVCADGEWSGEAVPANDSLYLKSENFTCQAKQLSDNRGYKIICDGDSVGVLLHGDEGEKGDKGNAGGGCSLVKLDGNSVRLFCGADSTTVYLGEPIDTSAVVIDSAKKPVSFDLFTGFAQKGPFLKTSKVAVFELADGRTLKKTQKAYLGEFIEDGRYKLTQIELASQYAMLEVDGRYLDETDGKESTAAVNLRAIVDLSGSASANVNVLTHLELDRVIQLVSRDSMAFKQAKKQAQSEIFAQFYIDAKDFDASENLDILGEPDEDAALLAVSILLHGGDFVITDSTKAAMADWAMEQDLRAVRKNVEKWNKDGKIGNFEKYIENFIANVISLESCNADNEDVLQTVNNKWSRHKGRSFICHEGTLGIVSRNTFFNPQIDYGWMVDLRDRHAYRTVKIGGQTWLAENLNYEYKISLGDSLVTYGNGCGADNCEVYGRYYIYSVAMDSAAVFSKNGAGCGMQVDCAPIYPVPGVCPEGWHLPDTTEFRSLISAFGDSLTAAKALKSLQLWADNKDGGSGNGKDNVGFDALPSGFAVFQKENLEIDSISNKDTSASFMSSVALKNDVNRNVYLLRLSTKENFAHVISGGGRPFGQSVRCIKD